MDGCTTRRGRRTLELDVWAQLGGILLGFEYDDELAAGLAERLYAEHLAALLGDGIQAERKRVLCKLLDLANRVGILVLQARSSANT